MVPPRSARRAVAGTRLAEINHVAATTGNDPELDTLLLRLHTETACRRGGALALRPEDLDPDQCLVLAAAGPGGPGRRRGVLQGSGPCSGCPVLMFAQLSGLPQFVCRPPL